MNSIIKKIKGKGHRINEHISEVTGERTYLDPDYYENIETGKTYSHIAGAIGFPGKGQPGLAVVMGVEKTTDPEPSFYVLDELEAESIQDLLNGVLKLRERWGYPNCLSHCYGDYERFMSIVSEFNLREKSPNKKWEGIYPSQPSDFERPNNFEIYYRQMDSCLTPPAKGKKRLILDSCNKLRNHIQNLPADVASKGDINSYPAVFVLGALIHTLLILKPWRKPIGRQHLHPTNYADYASREAAITKRHLFGGNSNRGHSNKDDLISTIDEN